MFLTIYPATPIQKKQYQLRKKNCLVSLSNSLRQAGQLLQNTVDNHTFLRVGINDGPRSLAAAWPEAKEQMLREYKAMNFTLDSINKIMRELDRLYGIEKVWAESQRRQEQSLERLERRMFAEWSERAGSK